MDIPGLSGLLSNLCCNALCISDSIPDRQATAVWLSSTLTITTSPLLAFGPGFTFFWPSSALRFPTQRTQRVQGQSRRAPVPAKQ